MEHYRCYRVIAAKTGGERITDTVQFFPRDVPMPETITVDRTIEVAAELTAAISKFKFASPLKDIHDTQMDGLHKLADILKVDITPSNTSNTQAGSTSLQQ